MIKITRTQAEAIAHKIQEQIRAKHDEKIKETITNVSEFPEVKDFIRTIRGFLETLAVVKGENPYISIKGNYIRSTSSEKYITETACRALYPEMFVDNNYVSTNTLIDDILVQAIMCDDLKQCMEQLVTKYA